MPRKRLKRRNPLASLVRTPKFRQRVERDRTKYTRKGRQRPQED